MSTMSGLHTYTCRAACQHTLYRYTHKISKQKQKKKTGQGKKEKEKEKVKGEGESPSQIFLQSFCKIKDSKL